MQAGFFHFEERMLKIMTESLEIVPVKEEEIPLLAKIADEIWHEHFPPIIGKEQTDYMVEKFQSEQAIANAVRSEHYRYYFFRLDGKEIGYLGIQPQGDALFLSKLYLKKEARGRKFARAGLGFLAELCKKEGYSRIRLTCNRDNKSSLAAYDKMGFLIVYEQDADIGNGFVMNDYVMEKPIG